jgi:hypothetical protein
MQLEKLFNLYQKNKNYSIGWIQILLDLKIQSESVRCNPFQPKFVHL